MTDAVKFARAKWYIELMNRFEQLVTKLHIPEDPASELKVFFLEIARSQYLAGNRSGIRWAREQMGLPTRQSAVQH